MGVQSLIAPPMLPLARPNPGKRSGSNDIEGKRPTRMRTPSPQARMPPRPASPQLSQHSHEERIPDGYVQRQVAEQEIQLIQQRSANEAMSRSREADEMARGWAAMQQQQHLLAESLREWEKELDRFRRGEHNLREELGAAQVSAESKRSQLILEERSMIHMAEERSAHHAMAITEAQAEERHTMCRRKSSEPSKMKRESLT